LRVINLKNLLLRFLLDAIDASEKTRPEVSPEIRDVVTLQPSEVDIG